jgi:hypothetical protein
MGVWACQAPWSHCDVPTNVIPSYIWLYTMHCTHQLCKQIWAHPLPNGHPLWQLKKGQSYLWQHLLWQLEEGQPYLKPKKKYNKFNVRINIMDEGYSYTMRVLQKWINKQKFKMKLLLKPSLEICIE